VVVRRVLFSVPLLFLVSALSFLLVSLTPGDAAEHILGTKATPQQLAALRHTLRLDLPVYEQYWRWLGGAIRGNLGTSLFTGQEVSTIIRQRLPATLSLVCVSLLVISVVGVALGVFSAVRGGALGRFVDGLGLIGFALPGFWVGAVLISVFAVKLHWFAAVGYVPLATSPVGWARSLVLPVTALALSSVSWLAKQTREAMLDVLGSEHVRMAWANGIPPRLVYARLALKNASLTVLTIVGLTTIGLLSGTVFVEDVFALPGLGSVLVGSTTNGDLPIVQGITVFFTLMIIVINLVVDLLYTLLDPRVRSS
jgi:peptide/nickel transport system permease protein